MKAQNWLGYVVSVSCLALLIPLQVKAAPGDIYIVNHCKFDLAVGLPPQGSSPAPCNKTLAVNKGCIYHHDGSSISAQYTFSWGNHALTMFYDGVTVDWDTDNYSAQVTEAYPNMTVETISHCKK